MNETCCCKIYILTCFSLLAINKKQKTRQCYVYMMVMFFYICISNEKERRVRNVLWWISNEKLNYYTKILPSGWFSYNFYEWKRKIKITNVSNERKLTMRQTQKYRSSLVHLYLYIYSYLPWLKRYINDFDSRL